MAAKPDSFLSYTRFDDRRGKVSEFRTWLSDAVEEVSGHPFDIFQDIEGIGLGKKWQHVLDEMLDQARFFIPILTPKFFNSGPCRDELTKFLELERKTGRQDLVLPIYWITCPVLEEGHLKAKDELAQAIDERQRWNWRELRYEAFESKEVQRDLSGLASQIERARRNVLRVVETSEAVVANGKPQPSSKAAPDLKAVPPQPKPGLAVKAFEAFREINEPWCPEMVIIPAGTFQMGSPENETGRFDDENQHEVTISQPFVLGRYPVTFDEYDYFCDQTGREKADDSGWGRGDRPVINVSHDDALAYCSWLSEATGRAYHLPSEAQWEYACRAGTTTAYAFGDEITKHQANFGEPSEDGQTSLVGWYPANVWGLHDMHGNVFEWCADWLGDYSYRALTDPKGPATGTERVVRGGSWNDGARHARAAVRNRGAPGERNDDLGFRCARVQEES